MSNEFANEYYAQLLDLTFNSKPLITALSQIAGEHVLDASVVVELILRRIQLVRSSIQNRNRLWFFFFFFFFLLTVCNLL
jgi:hypothetical protein